VLRKEREYVDAQVLEWEVDLRELLHFKELPAACQRQEVWVAHVFADVHEKSNLSFSIPQMTISYKKNFAAA
jgi:hypothetical protein